MDPKCLLETLKSWMRWAWPNGKSQRKILKGKRVLRPGQNFQRQSNRGVRYLMPWYQVDNSKRKWEEMTQEPQKRSKLWTKLEIRIIPRPPDSTSVLKWRVGVRQKAATWAPAALRSQLNLSPLLQELLFCHIRSLNTSSIMFSS